MSVAAESPFVNRLKRSFEPSDCSPPSNFAANKRSRSIYSAQGSPASTSGAYVVNSCAVSCALTALRKLFPGVDEKVMRDTLHACDNDVEAAIQYLNKLYISSETQGSLSSEDHEKDVQKAVDWATSTPPTAAGHREEKPSTPHTPEEWVETLVDQMSQAKTMDEARQRAAQVLQAFERAVLDHGQVGDIADLRAQLESFSRDNAILKRAVAIQNKRLQDIGNKEEELNTLRSTVQQYEQKIHTLEVSNYSLSMHLRQATEPNSFMSGQHNPDVF
eukprot:jgi/Botrbrau1/8272/Bobra.0251s0001.1